MKGLIKETGVAAGFAVVGVTSAEPVDDLAYLESAIGGGRVAGMGWLARDPAARCDPRSLLPSARSVICCALAYGDSGLKTRDSELGTRNSGGLSQSRVPNPESRVSRARFARGADYHVVVREKLERLWESIKAEAPEARAKLCVDTSPILEKALAQRAGLGWIGKHTVLVNRTLGSWFVLGEIITDIEIEPDPSCEDLCGDCTKCLDACPTRAIISPRELDARLCISYLTTGRTGPGTRNPEPGKSFPVPDPRSQVPNPGPRSRVPGPEYGCDLCQEACPYNIAK